MSTALKINPFSAEFHRDPYAVYRQLRTEDPICWSSWQVWIITGYAEAAEILKNPRFENSGLPKQLKYKSQFLKQGDLYPLSQLFSKTLFFLEGINHARLRGLLKDSFSLSNMQDMRSAIQKISNDLVDRVIDKGEMDIVEEFSTPLPAMVMASIIGVPAEEINELVQLSSDLFFIFDQPASLERYCLINKAAISMKEYFQRLVARRRKQPGNELIDLLVSACDRDKALTREEVISLCIMIFVAGQETTKSFISSSMLVLLKHPKQIAFVRDNPDRIQSVVEELLRYESPVQVLARRATEDIEVANKTIRTDEKVLVFLGAANRDPKKFSNPDRLDWNRKHTTLPFGSGIHYCLGAPLVRLQSQVAILTLVQRLNSMNLVLKQAIWRESIALRGLKSLPIRFEQSHKRIEERNSFSNNKLARCS